MDRHAGAVQRASNPTQVLVEVGQHLSRLVFRSRREEGNEGGAADEDDSLLGPTMLPLDDRPGGLVDARGQAERPREGQYPRDSSDGRHAPGSQGAPRAGSGGLRFAFPRPIFVRCFARRPGGSSLWLYTFQGPSRWALASQRPSSKRRYSPFR